MAAQDEGSSGRDRSDCPDVMRPMVRAFSFHARDGDRAALGISTTSGGMRDTLGLLVTGVANDGPADKAGIEEGDRLQAVNGTDLRLGAPDASDREMRGLMARRLIRVLDKLKPGDAVELRVYADGKVRTVKVTTEKASEAFRDDAGFGLTQGLLDGPTAGLGQLGGQIAVLSAKRLQGRLKDELGRLQDEMGDLRYQLQPSGAIEFGPVP
jgi:predicted metalloprotease with PDZ domain